MVTGQEVVPYQDSLPLCLAVWGVVLASGSQLHRTQCQGQGEEPPSVWGGGGGEAGEINSRNSYFEWIVQPKVKRWSAGTTLRCPADMDEYSHFCCEEIPALVSLVTWHWQRAWEVLTLSDDLVLANL